MRSRFAIPLVLLLLAPIGNALAQDGKSTKDAPQRDGKRAGPQGDDSAPKGQGPEPWARGIAQPQRERALALFRQGNELFVSNQCGQALRKYEDALGVWDHPAIRYNMAICILELRGSVLAAHEHMVKATRFGVAPLGEDKFREASRYLLLLRGQLGTIDVRCSEPETEVTLDGSPLFRGPGQIVQLIEPGKHQIVGTKAGFVTASTDITVVANKTKKVAVSMWRVGDVVQPVPTWVPITLTAAGVALVGAAIPLQVKASSNADEFDSQLREQCPEGCSESMIPSSTLDLRSRSRWQSRAATIGFVAGGVALVGGIVVFLVNKPRRPKRVERAWIPSVSGDGVAWSF